MRARCSKDNDLDVQRFERFFGIPESHVFFQDPSECSANAVSANVRCRQERKSDVERNSVQHRCSNAGRSLYFQILFTTKLPIALRMGQLLVVYHVVSYSIIFYHIVSYCIILYQIVLYSIIFCHIVSYRIIFYHSVSRFS